MKATRDVRFVKSQKLLSRILRSGHSGKLWIGSDKERSTLGSAETSESAEAEERISRCEPATDDPKAHRQGLAGRWTSWPEIGLDALSPKPCNRHMRITNTDGNEDSGVPNTGARAVTVRMSTSVAASRVDPTEESEQGVRVLVH